MEVADRVGWATVGVVLAVLLVSGPAVGGVDLGRETRPDQVGGGSAEVSVESLPLESFRITPGRFGTGVVYLRTPDLVVDVAAVEGRPRVVYHLSVPALDVDRTGYRVLDGGTGRVRISMPARAFESLDRDAYRGTVTVRVQSFDGDERVTRRTVRIEVK